MLQREALVVPVMRVVVQNQVLKLALLHEHVIGDNGHDKHDRACGPHEHEQVDNGGEEAGRNAAAQPRPKACVDLWAGGASGQASNNQEDKRERAHHRRYDDHDRLHHLDPLHLELELERGRQHLYGDRQRLVHAPAEDARAAHGYDHGDDGGERAPAQAPAALLAHPVQRQTRLAVAVRQQFAVRVTRQARAVLLQPQRFALIRKPDRIKLHLLFVCL